jgi:hypothetical protein
VGGSRVRSLPAAQRFLGVPRDWTRRASAPEDWRTPGLRAGSDSRLGPAPPGIDMAATLHSRHPETRRILEGRAGSALTRHGSDNSIASPLRVLPEGQNRGGPVGSVFRRNHNGQKRWVLKFRDVVGRKRQHRLKVRSRAEAERVLREVEGQVERQRLGLDEPPPPPVLFREIAERWLAERSRNTNNHASNESRLRLHLLPALREWNRKSQTAREKSKSDPTTSEARDTGVEPVAFGSGVRPKPVNRASQIFANRRNR